MTWRTGPGKALVCTLLQGRTGQVKHCHELSRRAGQAGPGSGLGGPGSGLGGPGSGLGRPGSGLGGPGSGLGGPGWVVP
jgi:hypothetical protein